MLTLPASSFRLVAFLAVTSAACTPEHEPLVESDELQVEVIAPGVGAGNLGPLLDTRDQTTVTSRFYSIDQRQSWSLFDGHPIADWQWSTSTSGVFTIPGRDGLFYQDLQSNERLAHNLDKTQPWLVVDGQLLTLSEAPLEPSHPSAPGTVVTLHLVPVNNPSATPTSLELPAMSQADRTYQPSLHHGANGTIYVVGTNGMLEGRPQVDEEWTFNPLAPTGGFTSWSDNPVWVSRGGTIVVNSHISFDGGETFTRREDGNSDAPWDYQSADGTLYDGAMVSNDGGKTWIAANLSDVVAPLVVNSNTIVRRRPGETHVEHGGVHLVAYDDGRVEVLAPSIPAEIDAATHPPSSFAVLEDGSFVGIAGHYQLHYTEGDATWRWQRTHELGDLKLRKLRDGRLVGFGTEAILTSEDDGATWSAPRQAPTLATLVETPEGWLGVADGFCAPAYYPTSDEFLTWDEFRGPIATAADGGDEEEGEHLFIAAASTEDGILVGESRRYGFTLSGDCQVLPGYAARSDDGAATARHVPVPEDFFRAAFFAATTQGGAVATHGSGSEVSLYLFEDDTWTQAGVPVVDARPVSLRDSDSQLDGDDRVILGTTEGLVRSLASFR